MLTTDAVISASSFDRRQLHPHRFEPFTRTSTMDYFQVNPAEEMSDCDAQSDKSNSSPTIKKSTHSQRSSSSRRKQAAPRSRLVRQCDECDFSSSVLNEFKTHLKFEHAHDQIHFCEQCRYYSSSSFDYQLHLHTHQTKQASFQANESDGELEDDDSLNIYSKERPSILFEHDEPISEDEQNPSTSTNKKLNLSVTSSHSLSTQQTPLIPDRKRPYNVSVDPARYRRVPDPDDASAVKFACSLCGNLYKWRKSLNKHWKEKHNDEEPPPLDAPVTIRPPKSSASTATTAIQSKPSSRPSELLPQTPMNPPPAPTHHPAFPINPYTWFNFASQQMFSVPTGDQALNAPLDLTTKSSNKTSSILPTNPMKKFHRDSNSSSDEQRDSANYNANDSEDDGHSEHASSSSPPNPYGQKIFICSICDQRFLTVESVNEHFLKNHLAELENEISGKSPPRNTNVAQQNEEWNLSDPVNPLKCIKCDFVGRWPTELQKHAASHSTSRPFKCLVCSLTYKWRWDLAKHWDRAHACGGKGANLINPYKKRDREQARSMMEVTPGPTNTASKTSDQHSTCSSISSSTSTLKKHSDDDEQSETSIHSDTEEPSAPVKRFKHEDEKHFSFANFLPPATTNMFFPPPSFFPPHSMFSSFLNPSLLLQPKFNYSPHPNLDLFKQASALLQQQTHSPNSSRSSSPRTSSPQQQRMQAVAAMVAAANGNSHSHRAPSMLSQSKKLEKEERNFQCRWCDYRGRWRSELIQHMRCHHARDKPYHCSACPYASSWKWDVQKHVKKQHVHDTAKIVELPDKYLFQTTLKAKYEGTDDRSLAPAPLTEEDYSYFGGDVQQKLTSMKYTRDRTLACQQCPFAANSMAELRRHIIVHSSESPYHCFNCDYQSKWKCDVKKHMRSCNHHGPVLVGRKAMAKVMESLGLVIGSSQEGNTKRAVEKATARQQPGKVNEIDEDEEEEIDEDEEESQSLIIVDENQESEQESEEDKPKQTNHSRLQNGNLRCRQCDYEADDLSDLLVHRKAHASMKYNQEAKQSKNNNSDIENDEKEKDEDVQFDQQAFDYELHWLENNPLIKQSATIQPKTRSILYNCSQCNYTVTNNRQYFLNHLDHQHSE